MNTSTHVPDELDGGSSLMELYFALQLNTEERAAIRNAALCLQSAKNIAQPTRQ